MLRKPYNFTVMNLILVVCFFAATLGSVRSALRKYPRPIFVPNSVGGGYRLITTHRDGMMVAIPENFLLKTYSPHVIRAPRPSLLRIWSPLCLTTFFFLITTLFFRSNYINRQFVRHHIWSRIATFTILVLILPLFFIADDTDHDYHEHTITHILFNKTIHSNPFFSRYIHFLMFQGWPGDFQCRVSTDSSIPCPYPTDIPSYGSPKQPKFFEYQFKHTVPQHEPTPVSP